MHGPEWITNEHQWPSWHGNMTTTSLIVNEEDEEPVASLVLPAQTENTETDSTVPSTMSVIETRERKSKTEAKLN
ncbi:Hypothetical predicted protein [Mytilus galloprovincialis]|uniref:Uncharacterized protein n=1 Tax=Mytilus galloprovincialis TaxID=29158 RepID=A0A8B6BHT9_MYTGA|nr:Hypothetical predicted protein [Mytilus galloprovincialis]